MNEYRTHTYETVEGTEPHAHVEHEPRTIQHTATLDNDHDLSMMTEIGDGVFVAWSSCRKCGKRVYECRCVGGPVEPDYIKRWREARFDKELNQRPEPGWKLLPSLIQWVKEHGYTVTKNDEGPGPLGPDSYGNDRIAGVDYDVDDDETFENQDRREQQEWADEVHSNKSIEEIKVDAGLDAAKIAVQQRAAQLEEDPTDVGF